MARADGRNFLAFEEPCKAVPSVENIVWLPVEPKQLCPHSAKSSRQEKIASAHCHSVAHEGQPASKACHPASKQLGTWSEPKGGFPVILGSGHGPLVGVGVLAVFDKDSCPAAKAALAVLAPSAASRWYSASGVEPSGPRPWSARSASLAAIRRW
jgi:hypothetical protein